MTSTVVSRTHEVLILGRRPSTGPGIGASGVGAQCCHAVGIAGSPEQALGRALVDHSLLQPMAGGHRELAGSPECASIEDWTPSDITARTTACCPIRVQRE